MLCYVSSSPHFKISQCLRLQGHMGQEVQPCVAVSVYCTGVSEGDEGGKLTGAIVITITSSAPS
jgi:hypothetical protein